MKPLYEALVAYSKKASAVFHMPGHKLGRGFVPSGVFSDPALLDATELDVTDDLHSPRGSLLEAQEMAARAFGAGRTWFLVNGTSCGIFAMIAAVCGAGRAPLRGAGRGSLLAEERKLLIARDFHYSAFNAMRFARVRPVYINVAKNGVLDAGDVERALVEHPDASAIYLTRPGYYGSVCDIEEIVRIARRRGGVPVLVDEAHGAHLSFSPRLPVSALEGGADFCIQSAHKTLPAFTQCAYAHVSATALADERGAAAAERMAEALRAFQTSSPSFILTASLDYAREYMTGRGRAELDRVLDRCESFYADMAALGYGIPGDIWTQARQGPPYKYARDMTRLVLCVRPIGLSGAEVERLLWSRHSIKIEMSDPMHIVMISTVSDSDEDFSKLTAALRDIAAYRNHAHAPASAFAPANPPAAMDTKLAPAVADELFAPTTPAVPDATNALLTSAIPDATDELLAPAAHDFQGAHEIMLDFITSLHAPKRRIPLKSAAGHAAASIVAPYPPGIPLLCPGEIITADTINEIRRLLRNGHVVKGIETANKNNGSNAGYEEILDMAGITIDVYM
ncbi:MAG: aminotransferase class V-fold PLP-dependent enzyme [Oscillospiraceae bacterium]|nr:aminotransferase class V-fold PLP-dependent enzyme [Oscillospiraceae bacterium]